MLRSTKDLEGYGIAATDGLIGQLDDFYFDDQAWVVRYMVVETGSWLASRKVLISPIAIDGPNWSQRSLAVALTQDQVRRSPAIDTEKPVSRQHEIELSRFYGYPYYWGGAGYWGGGMYPNLLMPGYVGQGSQRDDRRGAESAGARAAAARNHHADPHLRSFNEVMRYHIHASDGDIGHAYGMLIDDRTWAFRYLIVDTSNWWLGHKVLVAPQWIENVNWYDGTVSVNLTRQTVKEAPEYDLNAGLNRTEEARLYDHYGGGGYWTDEYGVETEMSRD